MFHEIFAMDSITVILSKYFKVVILVSTTKYLKCKSLEYFQLYGILFGLSPSL